MAILLGDNQENGNSFVCSADKIYVIDREDFSTPIADGIASEAVINIAEVIFGGNIMVMVYDDLGNLLASTSPQAVSPGINVLAFTTPLEITVSGGPYRMAVWMSANNRIAVDTSQTRTGSDAHDYAWTGTAPDPLPASSTYSNSTGRVYLYLQSTGPSITIANDLQPGASFTLNYSNYGAVPVSPVTITDSNNNSITVPVTINDNGDGTGTATGTMPSLPSSGTSQGLLFGNVTVELGT